MLGRRDGSGRLEDLCEELVHEIAGRVVRLVLRPSRSLQGECAPGDHRTHLQDGESLLQTCLNRPRPTSRVAK